MQAYSRAFAHVYNEKWSDFALRVAPQIRAFYESVPAPSENRTLLDLCCGTGQLAAHFLEHGYRVVGIDLSEHMLSNAIRNNASYVESGQARFVQGDAAQFSLDETFGLVVSTFDALNHLPGESALRACFACVEAATKPGGWFVFDLNTTAGLARWYGINIQDTEECMIVTRGLFDQETRRAWTRISGFLRTDSGLYQRFEETAFNTTFDLAWVEQTLLETGWRAVHLARSEDLSTPLSDPEQESRVFFVAHK